MSSTLHLFQGRSRLFKTGCANYLRYYKKWMRKTPDLLNWDSKSGCANAHPCTLGTTAPVFNTLYFSCHVDVGIAVYLQTLIILHIFLWHSKFLTFNLSHTILNYISEHGDDFYVISSATIITNLKIISINSYYQYV